MNGFQLREGERLLINAPYSLWCMTEMKKIPGTLKITGERVVFEKPEHGYFSFLKGMIKSLGSKVIFEIKRSEITAVEKIEAGKAKRLKIETKFERAKTFETVKMDTIIGELNRTIAKQ
jgi:hypothetical protein